MAGPFTAETEELRRYVRQWLDERASFETVRRIMESGQPDRDQWRELGELGWLGITIDPEYGGAGSGFAELAVIGEEMGRTLYPSPFLATAVMASFLLDTVASTDLKERLLGDVAAGARTATVAMVEPSRAWDFTAPTTNARRDGDRWLLTGTKDYVLDGDSADLILVVASTGEDLGLFVLEAKSPGLVSTPHQVMDLTRPLSKLEFNECEVELVASGAPVEQALTQMQERSLAYLAMEQVGGAQACLDMSVAYAKERHQFGRPIGSFQAVKHMCAEMLVDLEGARSAAYHLAQVIDSDPGEVAVAAPLAKSYCSDVFYRCAADTIQIHGGIGFTWEHDAHLYLKRAKSSSLLFGEPASHRTALAHHLGLS